MPSRDAAADGERRRLEELAESRQYLGMGVGVGVIGAASAAVLGATCPVCVVAAPALIGLGLYKRIRARRRPEKSEEPAAPTP